MTGLTLKAHFDGKHITLDEPFELRPGAPLAVTVLADPTDPEALDWLRAASGGLARAYSDDEPEYTSKDVKP